MQSKIIEHELSPRGREFVHNFTVKLSDKNKYSDLETNYGVVDYDSKLIAIDSELVDNPHFQAYVGCICSYFSPLAFLFERTGDSARIERSLYLPGICKYVEIKTMLDLDRLDSSLHFEGENGLQPEVDSDIVDIEKARIESIADEEVRKMNIAFRTVENLEERSFAIDPKPLNFKPQLLCKAVVTACAKRSPEFPSFDFDENFGKLIGLAGNINILDLYVIGELGGKRGTNTLLVQELLKENKGLVGDKAQARYVIRSFERIDGTLKRGGAKLIVRTEVKNALDALKKNKDDTNTLNPVEEEIVRKAWKIIEEDYINDANRRPEEYIF